MKNCLKFLYLPLLIIGSFLFLNKAQAATCTWSNGAANSLWNNAANWTNCGGAVPGASDTVVFDGAVSTASLDLDINPSTTIAGFTMEDDYTGTLDMNTNGLTVNGVFIKAGGTIEMNNSGDYFSITGDTTISGGTFAITYGAFIIDTGNLTISGDNVFQFGHTPNYPVMELRGSGSHTISISGTGNYISKNDARGELDINLDSVTDVITMTTDVQVHNFQLYEGTLALANGITLDIDGVFVGQSGSKLQMSNATTTIGRNDLSGGTVAIYHIQSGFTEDISGGTITIEGAGHGTYGTAYFENGSTYTPTGGTISFVGDDTGFIYVAETDDADFNLYNLSIGDGTNTKSFSLSTSNVLDLDLDGNLTINANATFDSNAENILVGGNWTNNNVYTHDNNTVTFNGTGTHTITALDSSNDDFYKIILAGGTMEIENNFSGTTPDMQADNDFTISGGNLDFNASFLKVSHDFSQSGGNIIMNQACAIEVDNDFTITGSAGANEWSDGYTTVSGDIAISGDNTFIYGGSGHPVFTKNGTGDFTISITGANNQIGNEEGSVSDLAAEFDLTLGTSVSTLTMSSDLIIRDLQLYKGEFITDGNNLTVYRVFVLQSTSSFTMASGNFTLGSDNLVPTLVAIWHQSSGSTATISGGTITIEGAGHATYGTMYLADGSIFDHSGGTFQFIGDDDATIYVAETGAADFNFYNLSIGDSTNEKTVSINAASAQALDINGNLAIKANATLDTNSIDITLAGTWENDGGFLPDSGTVTFDHADTAAPNNKQYIIGDADTNFYNFIKDCRSFTNTQELVLAAGRTYTIADNTIIRGKNGGLLTINSNDDVSPTSFNIYIPASNRDMEYLNVKNSNQTNTAFPVYLYADGESTGSNYNSGWSFVNPGISGGNISSYNQATGSEQTSQAPQTNPTLANGTLVKLPNDPKVYLIENGYRRHIYNEQTFLAKRFSWSDILEVDNLDAYPLGQIIIITSEPQPTTQPADSPKYLFTRNLKYGSFGEDVLNLQKFFNSHGFIVAENGPGSLGKETKYFGHLTEAALMGFQNKYRKEILDPLGLKRATGYFGPSTRKFVNSF